MGRDTGVLLQGGAGAGAFPFDTGGVGSELACMARLVGRLTVWSFWIAEVTVVSALSNNCSTLAVSSSAGLSGVSEVLVLWKCTVLLLRYTVTVRPPCRLSKSESFGSFVRVGVYRVPGCHVIRFRASDLGQILGFRAG